MFDAVTIGGTDRAQISIWRSPAVHRFGWTLLILATLVAGLRLLAPAEHALFAGPGITDVPFSSLALVRGLPHFIIGFLFMITSTANRGVRGWLPIAVSILIGSAIISLLNRYGAMSTNLRVAPTLIGLYFFLHTFLDEAHFYRRDAGNQSRCRNGEMGWLIVALIATFGLLMWSRQVLLGDPAYNLRHYLDPNSVSSISRSVLWFMVGAPCAIIAVGCYRVAVRRAGVGIISLIRRDRPLWCVYGLIFAAFMLSIVISGKLSTIVLIHLIAWWTFVTRTLATNRQAQLKSYSRPQAPDPGLAPVQAQVQAPAPAHVHLHAQAQTESRAPGVWTRIRHTQAGFQLFHAALVLGVLVLLVPYVHNLSHLHGTVLDYALTQNGFLYWTVIHVTISLFPPVIRARLAKLG